MAAPRRSYTAAEVLEEIFRDEDRSSGDEYFDPADIELCEADANTQILIWKLKKL